MANYVQRGETIDYTATSALSAGAVVALDSCIGIAGGDIAKGETGALHVVGVFEFPSAEALTLGKKVYWSGTAITATASSNTPAGFVVKAVGSDDTSVLVKIG